MLVFITRIVWLLWCWIELSVFSVTIYTLSWLPRVLTRSYFHALLRIWSALFVRALGVTVYLHEKNQHPIPKQYILIANHPSAFEDVGVPYLFNVYMLAKQGVRGWWWIGRIHHAAGTVFVKRDNKESRHKAVDALLDILQQGKSVALFPEGGCKGRRIYDSFQAGAFDLSIRTGIPILPVFLHYEAQETFEWRDPDTLVHKMWHFMTGQNARANYYLYDAIYPENRTDKHAFAEEVRQKYLEWQSRYLE